MKSHAALAVGLVSLAYASPMPRDIFARQQTNFDPMCSLRPDDASYWKDYDMETFVKTEEHAQAVEAHVTQPGNPAKQKSFLLLLIDLLPDNQWTCTSEKRTCDTNTLICKNNPRVVKTIKAVVNYLDVLRSAKDTFNTAVTEVVSGLAAMQGTFNPSTKSELGSSELDQLAAGMGIVGTLAGLLPGPTGQYSSAIFSIASSAMSTFGPKSEDKLEVKFDGFADMGRQLHETVRSVTNALDKAINDLFVLPPPKTPAPAIDTTSGGVFTDLAAPSVGWNTDPGYAPNVISDGSFAVPRNSDWTRVSGTMKASLYSQAINYLWKKEKVVVMKISKKYLNVDPCDPAQPDILFSQNTKYCDPDGNMYVLQARPTLRSDFAERLPIEHQQYKVPGFGELEKFGLTPRDVITSSWRNQRKIAPSEAESKQALADYAAGDLSRPLTFFSLQTCDLDQVGPIGEGWCWEGAEGIELAYCTMYGRLDRCRDLDHGVDQDRNPIEWPWAPFELPLPPTGARM